MIGDLHLDMLSFLESIKKEFIPKKKKNGVLECKETATISRSSTESECCSLALTAAELFWIRMVMKDLGIFLNIPPIIYCDNISAIALAFNPV